MPLDDSEREERRLAKVYSEMADDELLGIAASRPDLTDIAQGALQEELRRRKIEFPQTAPATSHELEFREMVVVAQFRDLPTALLAKGSLDSAGIECILIDENLVRMDWFISNLIGGVKLEVNAEDAAIAREILNQPIPDNLDVEGVGNYKQPRCPKCQSLEISYQELYKPVAYPSAWLGMPFPIQRRAWRCGTCAAEWEDSFQANDRD